MWTFLCLILSSLAGYVVSQQRPLYLVGHMTNEVAQIDEFLRDGANAIEADLAFDKDTHKADVFYHGVPCDCFRACLKKEKALSVMTHLRDIATPGHAKFNPNFASVAWIDLKLSDSNEFETAGKDFANLLIDHVYNGATELKLSFELWKLSHWPFVVGLQKVLEERKRLDIIPHLGLSVSGQKEFQPFIKLVNSDPKYSGFGRWLGDGITNCLESFFKIGGVKEAVRLRDEGLSGVAKVTRWTVDKEKSIRNAFWLGVDALITNKPHRVLNVLNESEFKHRYRLATRADNPFKTIQGHGPYRYGCSEKSTAIFFNKQQLCWKDTDSDWCWTSTSCDADPKVCSMDLKC